MTDKALAEPGFGRPPPRGSTTRSSIAWRSNRRRKIPRCGYFSSSRGTTDRSNRPQCRPSRFLKSSIGRIGRTLSSAIGDRPARPVEPATSRWRTACGESELLGFRPEKTRPGQEPRASPQDFRHSSADRHSSETTFVRRAPPPSRTPQTRREGFETTKTIHADMPTPSPRRRGNRNLRPSIESRRFPARPRDE